MRRTVAASGATCHGNATSTAASQLQRSISGSIATIQPMPALHPFAGECVITAVFPGLAIS
jgi:hypothetical protein